MKQFTEKLEHLLELGGTKKDITLLVISGVALLFSIFHLVPLPFDWAWIAIILCGIPIILEAVIGLITAFDIKADVLVSLALIASVCIGEDFAAGEVAFIMQLGALLEDLTVAKARDGIEKLVHLTPQTARVINGKEEKVIPAEQVRIGEILRVLPGETVPVDGVIISGQTSVNQAVMTGESLPVDKTVGDEVSSGTVNQYGSFEMRASRVGEDSSIQRMIRLVQSADAGKAKIVGIADRWATWIVVIALSAAALTWIFTGEIIRAVTILVVFCPCALVLATPTAIMAAIGNATKHGFLVREGDALERLAAVSKIAFDKTGTLTYGMPQVTAVKSALDIYSEDDIFKMAACAEQFSEHPLGKAIVRCYKQKHLSDHAAEGNPQERNPQSESGEKSDSSAQHQVPPCSVASLVDKGEQSDSLAQHQVPPLSVVDKGEQSDSSAHHAEQFQMIPGRGVSVQLEGETVFAGNREMLDEHHITVPADVISEAETYLRQGSTIIYIAVKKLLAGYIVLSDTIRKENGEMIHKLDGLGVQPVLLTGDNVNAAGTIAKQLHIREIHANCLPEDKLNRIDDYQQKGEAVCMIGDGVNDAPALKKANVGIAMGGVGSDIAVDAADIALVDDEVKELPHLLALSKRMMTTIRRNLTFSMSLNFLAIILAITGILNPVVGALVHNAGSVFVIINSALLLKWKFRY